MGSEIVTVAVGSGRYTAWEEVAIRASVKAAARAFELKIAAELGAAATASVFQPYAAVQIFAVAAQGPSSSVSAGGGDLLVTGYIDHYKGRLTKKEAFILIPGRSKAQDAIDASVEHRKSDYVNQTLLQIAQDQDQFGVGFALDPSVTLAPIDRWRPNPGETLFEALDPLCHDAECTMAGQPDGSVLFTAAGVNPPRQSGMLVQGDAAVLEWDGDIDVSGLHSKIHVHGQAAYGNGAQNTQISVRATNATVPRNRPLHLHHHRHTSQARLLKKASHHRDHEAGNSIRARLKVQGWRDSGGALWTPGFKVWVESPFLAIVQDMLIESVTYKQDVREGTTSMLDLVDPRAHGGQGGGVNQSGSAWGMDASDAVPDSPGT